VAARGRATVHEGPGDGFFPAYRAP
jgi:hypothetical protein